MCWVWPEHSQCFVSSRYVFGMAHEDRGSLIRIWQNMTIMATDIVTVTVMVTVTVTVTRCWQLGLWILALAGILNSVISLARSVVSGRSIQDLSIHADCRSIMVINIKIRPSVHHTITIWE